MKAYFIFVVTLTITYIVYYAVMITKDLHENGEKKKSEEEEFDVGEFDAEESVSVVENDKGFNVGDNEYETHYVDGTQYVSDDKEPEGEKHKQDVVAAFNHRIEEKMEETHATFSNPYNSAELYKLMMGKGLGNSPSNGGVTTKPAIDEL